MKIPQRAKILIARGDVLGDVITATALVGPIKHQYPDALIFFLVRPEFTQLISGIQDVSGVIDDIQPYDGKAGSPEFNTVLAQVKDHQFDVMINLWERPRYAILAKRAGIKVRIGHAIGWENRWCHTHAILMDYRDYHRHKVEMNLALLRPLGIRVNDAKLNCHISDETLAATLAKWPLLRAAYRVVVVDAGAKVKCLVDAEIRPILSALMAVESTPIVLLGHTVANATEQTIDWIRSTEQLIDLTGKTSLLEVASILKNASYFVGPDSGLSHIAAAVGCPSVVIYRTRTQNGFHWAPWLCRHVIIKQQNRCADQCLPLSCTQCTRTEITPNEVGDAVTRLRDGRDGSDGTYDHQKEYWDRVCHQAAILCDSAQFDRLKAQCPVEWNTIHLAPTLSIRELKQVIVAGNINLVLCSGRPSIKLRLACIWASNYIHFLPVVRRFEELRGL